MTAKADATSEIVCCPKCGKQVESLQCGHCGSRLPIEQADLYGAVIRQIAKMGGNQKTDASRQGGSENDDPPKDNGGASTPQWLFDRCNQLAIKACGEPITLDVAAAEWNHKCDRYYTEEDDALKQNWDAKAGWCNPPYSATVIEAFVRKAIDAAQRGTTVVCLLPWWNYPYLDLCEQHGQVHRIGNPVSFKRQDGTTLGMNNQYGTTQLVVVVFGPTIRPGFGVPIRKNDAVSDPSQNGDTDADDNRTGITARALAGDGDHRRENDAYYTPPWAIDSLLKVEKFDGLTWEPAEGDKRIVEALQQVGGEVFGTDVATGTDFLTTSRKVDNVVTNPPWDQKTEFIRHAKECARRKVVMLLPLSALSGVARRPLFEDTSFPLRTVYVFERRPNFHPDSKGSSTITAGWFVWERDYQGEPVLRWM